jgi:hypothetical protein
VSAVLLRPRWVALHLLVVVLVLAFSGLAWWQFDRAREGNMLSIGYACEWPAFALFTVGVWIWLCRDAVRPPADAPDRPAPVDPDRVPDELVFPVRETVVLPLNPDDDAELLEYNRMLDRLNRQPRS